MKNVGEFDKRNEEYKKVFSKERLIKSVVGTQSPIIFDIGAHHGQSVEYFHSILPNSKVYSFEPDPNSYKIIKSRRFQNNLCFNIAFSNQDGRQLFYRNKISHTNSLFKVNVDSKDSIRLKQERESKSSLYLQDINRSIQIDVVTLDSFVSSNAISNIDLMKIDVQGSEVNVLKGGKSKSLPITKAISIEISFYDFYENKNSFHAVESILIPLGFEMYSILDISQNPMNGRTDWAEVIYLRK